MKFSGTLIALSLIFPACAYGAGGPLGIDHKWSYDNSGIFKRQTQKNVLTLMVVGEVAAGLWEGDQSRLGKTSWQAIDATIPSVSSRTAGAPRCFSLKSGAITTTLQCKRGCLQAMTYRQADTPLPSKSERSERRRQ